MALTPRGHRTRSPKPTRMNHTFLYPGLDDAAMRAPAPRKHRALFRTGEAPRPIRIVDLRQPADRTRGFPPDFGLTNHLRSCV